MDNKEMPNRFEESEPEKKIIYYRLKEFVSNYENEVQKFFNNYCDATELDFINETIKRYYIYIKNVTLINDLYGNCFIESDFKGVNIIEEIIDKVKSNTTNEICVENCNNFYYSFTAIINYLESRKNEIENENFNKYYKSSFKSNITQTEISIFPFLTQHGKNLFEEYLKTSTDYNDISFIFYQLTESNPPEMVKMKYINYIDWLKENKYITENEYKIFENKLSLNKKSNAQFRIDKFNEIKNRLKEVV